MKRVVFKPLTRPAHDVLGRLSGNVETAYSRDKAPASKAIKCFARPTIYKIFLAVDPQIIERIIWYITFLLTDLFLDNRSAKRQSRWRSR